MVCTRPFFSRLVPPIILSRDVSIDAFQSARQTMILPTSPFQSIDWNSLEGICHDGETGHAIWRTIEVGSMRVRRVDYSAGYLADHWCIRGHVVTVHAGVLETELQDGRRFVLTEGMSYIVSDAGDFPHRSRSADGAIAFIVD
jgi:hypothetical protein